MSLITVNMMNFVMATRIFEKTGSTVAVSLLWVFYYLPSLLFGPFSGYFVDLMSLRKTLFWTNIAQAVTMLMFLFIGDKFYMIYPIIFLYSFLNQFYYPAESSSIPWLVAKEDLSIANSLFLLTSQTALVIGLGFSGILMRLFGKGSPVYISAFCLFLAGLVVHFLPKKEPKKEKKKEISQFFEDIKFGYSYIKDNRIISFPVLIIVFFQILIVGMAVSIPSLAVEILKVEAHDAGPLLILPLGLGALFSALYLARNGNKFRKKVLIKRGMLGMFSVLVLFSLLLPLLGNFKIFAGLLLSFLLGVFSLILFVPAQTLLQENTPPELRGRVFGAVGFLCTISSMPFLLFSAAIVETIGVRLFMLMAAFLLSAGLFSFEKIEKIIVNEKENGNK